jgi:hypothetical protein
MLKLCDVFIFGNRSSLHSLEISFFVLQSYQERKGIIAPGSQLSSKLVGIG